jgi:hypothetical protein
MNIGWVYREFKSKAPPFDRLRAGFLAKNARNGAPGLLEGYVANGVVGHPPHPAVN